MGAALPPAPAALCARMDALLVGRTAGQGLAALASCAAQMIEINSGAPEVVLGLFQERVAAELRLRQESRAALRQDAGGNR